MFSAVSATFESLGHAVALLDDDLQIVEASPAFRGLVGTADVDQHHMSDFIDLTPIADKLRAGERCGGHCEVVSSAAAVDITAARLPEGVFEAPVRYALTVQLRENGSRNGDSDDFERIRHALEEHRWRRSAAARSLGISRATLWRRMRDYGLL
ncbi:MAG TPA: helix-turn-helix domain-containing protein [Thermoanaerobaculia bacterium]